MSVYDVVVHPTDGSVPADHALARAVDVAETTDAALHVLYVVPTPGLPPMTTPGRVSGDLADVGEAVVEESASRARTAGLDDVTTAVVEGRIHESIRRYAAEVDADLVVAGTHGREGVERYLLGSVAERLLRTSDVPVMVVPAAAGDTVWTND
ncbi:universal stress protein [Haloplanus sp. GCM10025708]|uniref:universal stress protein n=1 Tax=Haloferacaceae TaxID=1644056 RepID=UPI003613A83E